MGQKPSSLIVRICIPFRSLQRSRCVPTALFTNDEFLYRFSVQKVYKTGARMRGCTRHRPRASFWHEKEGTHFLRWHDWFRDAGCLFEGWRPRLRRNCSEKILEK